MSHKSYEMKDTSKLKPFHFNVIITGQALVYAYDLEGALQLLEETGVMVAGNKMRNHIITVDVPNEE